MTCECVHKGLYVYTKVREKILPRGTFNSTVLPNHFSDIDECTEGISGCSQNCTNMMGSYTCSCNSGFSLLPDNRTCIGETTECTYEINKCICKTFFKCLL